MDNKNEVKKEIERLKREMSDYLKLSKLIKVDEKTREKRIDIYLEDLSKLMKKLN
jgi:hypothetical protein